MFFSTLLVSDMATKTGTSEMVVFGLPFPTAQIYGFSCDHDIMPPVFTAPRNAVLRRKRGDLPNVLTFVASTLYQVPSCCLSQGP